MSRYEQERREFVRVNVEVLVRYKFLSTIVKSDEFDNIYEGITSNISGGGLLLIGKIPNLDWIPQLLMKKIVIGVNVFLPTADIPVKALTRAAWIEAVDETSSKCAIGLTFKEITTEDRDKIFAFIIKSQLPS